MEECIFCKIIEGKIPSYKIYEDDDFLAFLDIQPLNPGHTLLIPKKHYHWVEDVPNYDQYWQLVKKISQKIQKVLNPVVVAKIVYGLGVPHAHIHLIPKFKDDGHEGGINPKNVKKLSDCDFELIAQKLKL